MLHEVFKFLLSFGDLVPEDVGLLLLGVVEFIDLGEFLFCLYSEALCDIEVVVCSFVVHLVGGELLLGSIEPHSHFLLVLLDLVSLGLHLLELQLQLLLPSQVLLLYLLLQACVEAVVGSQELKVLLFFGLGHE